MNTFLRKYALQSFSRQCSRVHTSALRMDVRKDLTNLRAKASASRATTSSSAAYGITMASACVLTIPLYKLYCQHYGGSIFDQEEMVGPVKDKLPPVEQRREIITLHFNCESHSSMPVQFVPCQKKIEVCRVACDACLQPVRRGVFITQSVVPFAKDVNPNQNNPAFC